MADSFHFNPETGRTGKCDAKTQCRFGQSEGQHGASREDARANYEATMETELFSNTQVKQPAAQSVQIPPRIPAPLAGGFGGGSRLDQLRAAQDAERRQRAAGVAPASAPAQAPKVQPGRFTGSELDAEANEFRAESGYSVQDIIRTRQLTEASVREAEANYDGWITVKIPGGSEERLSSELVRRELKSAPPAPRRW